MLKFLFFPFSLLIATGAFVRRYVYFGFGFNRRKEFRIPTICIGNLSMGGTGKTPHTEFLIRTLKDKYKVATLSRGYKRKTSGFLCANETHQVLDIGDEPLQYFKEFKDDVIVAVDEKRVRGVEQLVKIKPDLQVVLLDDAYQHLAIKAGLNILLTDYFSPYYKDYVFPVGTLREHKSAAKHADIIVVTKCPKTLSPIIRDFYLSKLKPKDYQKVFFSYFAYGDFVPINEKARQTNIKMVSQIVLLTGIVNPYPLREYLNDKFFEIHPMAFPDHHDFMEKDIAKIKKTFHDILTSQKAIITTQKDAMRLMTPEIADFTSDLPLFYVPLQVKFHAPYEYQFQDEVNYFIEGFTKV